MKVAVFLGFQIAFVYARIRYTYVPSDYVGIFEDNVNVTHVNDCATLAKDGQKIGFMFKREGDSMTCALLKQFSRFMAKTDSKIHDYILDTKADDNICHADSDRNVSDIISGSCAVGGSDCHMLEKIKTFCALVGTDITNCVSSNGYTVADVECPSGNRLLKVQKEVAICCPHFTELTSDDHCCIRGEQFQKRKNGRDFCCKRGKHLKAILEDKPLCCAASDTYKAGTAFCCPENQELRSVRPDGKPYCCWSYYDYYEKYDYCCPKDTFADRGADGLVGCFAKVV